MSTRFKSDSRTRYGQPPLPTGYEKGYGTPDLTIPHCGVEDVDVAVFNLFEKEIVLESGGINGTPVGRVPVIFAAGEKWALLKKGRPLRDRNNTLILPLITIMRTELNQSTAEDVAGRGINQQVGEIIIRRRLDKSDRNYQSLINKLLLPNQDNLAVGLPELTSPAGLSTQRKIGELHGNKWVTDGAYLKQHLLNNVYETLVVPTPQFYTVKYQVTVWSQYTQHANQIVEKIFSSLLPQAQSWRLDTAKGYWFVAKIEDGSLAMETNFEDMSSQERFIKHTFNVAVPAYFFASSSPGTPVPVKRYVSSPSIKFESSTNDSAELDSFENKSEYVLGSDDPTLPLDMQKNNRRDQRTPGWRQQKIYPVVPDTDSADALIGYEADTLLGDLESQRMPASRNQVVKTVSVTSKGETVYSGVSLGELEIVVTK